MLKKSWKAIAAISLNHVMGKGGKLPWNIPEDLAWFKEVTSGHTIVMGRKTFDSINRRLLPNRQTIVVSRTLKPEDVPAGVMVIHSLDELNQLDIQTDIFLVGGSEIYASGLSRCSDLYLTWVKHDVEGDVVFPQFESIFAPFETVRETPEIRIVHYKQLKHPSD